MKNAILLGLVIIAWALSGCVTANVKTLHGFQCTASDSSGTFATWHEFTEDKEEAGDAMGAALKILEAIPGDCKVACEPDGSWIERQNVYPKGK